MLSSARTSAAKHTRSEILSLILTLISAQIYDRPGVTNNRAAACDVSSWRRAATSRSVDPESRLASDSDSDANITKS